MPTNPHHTAQPLGERIAATRERLLNVVFNVNPAAPLAERNLQIAEANARLAAGPYGDVL